MSRKVVRNCEEEMRQMAGQIDSRTVTISLALAPVSTTFRLSEGCFWGTTVARDGARPLRIYLVKAKIMKDAVHHTQTKDDEFWTFRILLRDCRT
jgi:hypothetical protein